jgi:hypothetical protein
LIIDNVDTTNSYFLETINTLSNEENIKTILVAKNKENIDLNNKKYHFIEIQEPSNEIKKQIFENHLNIFIKKKFDIPYSLDEITDILMDSDKITSLNQINIIQNPKLGKLITYNAYTISEQRSLIPNQKRIITKDDFIKGLDYENINMDPQTKEEIKERFKNLEPKTKKELKKLQKRKEQVKWLKK